MKKRILLIDESLTVQKVVALTLDKNRYIVQYAKSRAEALKGWTETSPDLVLVGDQVPDVNVSSFPKEIEVWLGRGGHVPPMILITSQDVREQKHYAAVLKKPFAPATLQSLVVEHARERRESESHHLANAESEEGVEDFEDERLQKIFNDTFADESSLVRETFQTEADPEEATFVNAPAHRSGRNQNPRWEEAPGEPLWEPQISSRPTPSVQKEEDLWGLAPSAASKPTAAQPMERREATPAAGISDSDLTSRLEEKKLDEIVDRVLSRIVPPIVERLVQERLDKLLKAHEEFVELKP